MLCFQHVLQESLVNSDDAGGSGSDDDGAGEDEEEGLSWEELEKEALE